MSQSERSKESEQEQDQNSEEEEDQEQNSQGDEQEEQNEDQDQDQDENQEDEDQQQDQNQQGEEQENQQENQEEESNKQYKLPSFPNLESTQNNQNRMAIEYINSEIASLELSVDSFISSLSSQGGTYPKLSTTSFSDKGQYISHLPLNSAGFDKLSNNYHTYKPKPYNILPPPSNNQPIHIKDFEIQVDMQPQIVIQNVSKLPPLQKKSNSYIINSEAQNYLSKLSLNEKSKQVSRFQRKQQDVIDWQKRNKEIDEAMRVMKQKY